MTFEKTIYIIHEDTDFTWFPFGRFDIGEFYVEEKDFDDLKDFMIFCSDCCENFINENIFFDIKIANKVALERTINKFQNVLVKGED